MISPNQIQTVPLSPKVTNKENIMREAEQLHLNATAQLNTQDIMKEVPTNKQPKKKS